MQRRSCRGPEAGLLSRESAAAVDTAFNKLAQTVKKHEPTLEDVVREDAARAWTVDEAKGFSCERHLPVVDFERAFA
jgi:hypothetical protein